MKEKKQWKKRIVSMLMALAMVITQIGVWNAGKESVQAAETEVYKADFSDASTDAWNANWSVSSDDTTFVVKGNYKKDNDQALNIWSKDAQVLTMTHTETNIEAGKYYLSIKTNGGNVNGGKICVSDGQNEKKSDIAFAEELTTYKTTEPLEVATGASVTITVTIDLSAVGWGYIDDITLTKSEDSEDAAGDDADEYVTKILYFKYTGNGTPAILLWDNCGDSLKMGDDTSSEIIDNKVRYTMKSTGQNNWYQIVFKYKTGEVKNKNVGFDFGEISDHTYSWIQSMDYVYANNHNAAYEIIFSDKYSDPAIIQGDYDTVVSYADAIEKENNSDSVVKDAPITVKKVKGLNERADFIKGIDISTYLVETDSGVKYKDQSGQEVKGKDFIRMFAQNGVNYIRLRVWNQPYDTDSSGNKLYYGGGNNDIEMAVEICKLIKEYNTAYADRYGEVKVLIDLHYSDFWADPDKQTAPKAWKDMSIDAKTTAVAEFTKDCLANVEATGVTVGMLQIGNETNNGICGESYGSDNYLAIFKAGCDAVKEYNESKGYTTQNGKWIKRVVHFTDPQSVGTSKALYLKTGDLSAKDATNPTSKGVDYDVYATSYYPFWHGTTDNLNNMLGDIASTCGCEVMVAETQYVYTNADYDGADNQAYEGKNNIDLSQWPVSVQGQANEIRDVIDAVAQVDDNKGIGMFYWEPAWLGVGNAYNEDGTVNESALNSNKTKWNQYGSGWASDYAGTYDAQAQKWGGGGTNNENASLFDFEGNPLASLNVFKYVNYGAVAKNKSFYAAKSLSDVVVKMGDSKDAIKNQLEKTVAYTYNDETPGTANITWDETSLAKAEQEISLTKAIGNSYTITGTIDVDGTKQKVSCNILVDPSENLLANGDFEAYAKKWNFNFAQESKILWSAIDAKGNVDKDANPRNDSKGSIVFNTYSNVVGNDNTAQYYSGNVSQTVTIEKAGIYEAKAFFEGLDKAGSNDGEAINLSVTDGNETTKVSNAIKLDGWKVWQCATVSNIVVTQDMINSGKNTVTVSANVCIKKDVWGSIDDVYLYKVGEVTASGNGGSSTVTPSAPSAPNDANTDTKDDNKKEDQKDDQKDVVTEEKNITATTPSGKKVEATVTVSKDKDGNVTEASAKVAGTKAAISAEAAKELAKAAGTDRIAITASVTDKNGNEKYTVTVDSKNLTANKKLHVVAIDPKTGEYKLVNAKTYKVGKDGTLNVKLADGADYQMLTATELKAVEKSILKTVEVKKSSVTVKNGKKTQIQLSSALDMDNVKSITYKTSKKSVATVSKSGKITTNKKGTVTIKAIVTLKNGKKKTVSMTLKVK